MPSFAGLDIDDNDLIADVLATKPEPEDHLGSTVIVDGCPVVGPAKLELLKKFLLEKFSKLGTIVSHHFALDKENQTKGYVFITYDTGKAASQAVRVMNNTALDKSHTLQVTLLADYERLTNVNTEWKPPTKQEYKDVGNLKSWLLNELCRDQFAVVYNDGEFGAIYWHNAVEPTVCEERERWTDGWMRWSPQGTYLATMHQPGVILWGGEKFSRVGRFPHKNVKMVDFSPKEQFIVSLSPRISPANTTDEPDRAMADIIIWDVKRCVSRREFSLTVDTYPAFRWSHNDEYFGCIRESCIAIYETSTFRLLDKKRLGGSIKDFSWSPTENIIAYWEPESHNTPARVVLMEVPSREELCTKNLFSVAEIGLTWHDQGDFLAIQVLRCAKKKVDADNQIRYMGTYMNLEIVRMREKLYPVDQLEVKASVSNFHWEPHGTRFAFLQSAAGKLTVTIYDVQRGGSIKEVFSLELPAARKNDIKWSPTGNMLVVAGLRSMDSYLEFISANDAMSLAKGDHPMLTEIYWDPTGRYLSSVVSSLYQRTDNAIWFWNSVGRCLYKLPLDCIRTFTWRPRPPTLLSKEQLQNLQKNMSKYNSMFANEDRMLATKASRALFEKRQRLLQEFSDWRNGILRRFGSEKTERMDLRGGQDTDNVQSDQMQTIEEELELPMSSVKEIVKRSLAE